MCLLTITAQILAWLVFSFSCDCPVIDHEYRHNIVRVALDPRGDNRVDPQTNQYDNVMTKFTVNNRRDALKTDINLLICEAWLLSAPPCYLGK